jgi:hypothetical protein
MRTDDVIAFTLVVSISAAISAAVTDAKHLPVVPMYPVNHLFSSTSTTSSTSIWPSK